MSTNFKSNIFESTFNKHVKLLVTKLNLKETDYSGEEETQFQADNGHHYKDDIRDVKGRVSRTDVVYNEKLVKGEVTKITATLSGNSSGTFTVAIDKLKQIEELERQIAVISEEIRQEGVREKVAAFFGSQYEFTTRVVDTVSLYHLVLAKQAKTNNTVKWESVYKELVEQLTPELANVANAIVKKYTTEGTPKPPSLKIQKVDEGLGDIWNSFLGKVKSWGSKFDSKIGNVKSKIDQL